MIFLRLLTLPYLRKHKLRSALTLAGIAIGVAVFTGMHTANQTVARAFGDTVDRIAGKAQLQVTAGEAAFPEATLEKVQAVREVTAAAPVIEAVLNTGLAGQGSLLVLGVDMTGDRSLRDYSLDEEGDDAVDDPLIFLAQPDSLILSREFAEKNGIRRNQKLRLETMQGPREFTVRGIMKAGGLASAFGGNLAVMDIYAAQLIFGRGRMFDRIDVGLAEGVSIAEGRRQLEAALGPTFEVLPPPSRTAHFESVSRGLVISINITSLFALVIGVFIIYNAFSIAITERRGEIGILRALGASKQQVLGMFLAESAVAGVIGSALGIVGGLALARGITPLLSYLVNEVYGTPQMAGDVAPSTALVALAMAIGILASLAGGFLPARAAASVDPVRALQKGRYQVLTEGENRARRIAAIAVAAIAGVILFSDAGGAIFYIGYVLAILSLLLLAPALALWLARAARPLLKFIRPVEGTLAADSLIQAPRRTSATVSALMLSLALAVGFAGVSGSIYTSVLDWMDGTINPDLFVAPSESITQRTFRFPGSMAGELAAVPGVEEVQQIRNMRMPLNGVPAMAVVADVAQVARRIRIIAVQGDAVEMAREAAAGRGIIISDSLSTIRGWNKGDVIELPAPDGPLRMKVLGTTVDFSDQQGSFILDQAVYRRHWKDDTANVFRIYTAKGRDPEAVRTAILKQFSAERKVFVYTNRVLRKFILDTTAQWFGLTYIQLGVALLVAILGIVNTLTVSITDRRRELGVLQAIGGMRNQIRQTIWMEAMTIGGVALVLGWVLGSVTLFYNLRMVAGDMAGLRLSYAYPFAFAAWLTPVVLGAALLAALWPAEAAVRSSLVEALEYE